MERTGTLPRSGIDDSDLTPLVGHPGPLVSLALATPAATENAGSKASQRWSTHRRRLAADGAPEGALGPVDALVADAHLSGEGVAIFSDDSGPLLVVHSTVPPRHELARWDRPPTLTPVLDWRQHQPGYVVALVDRTGAELFASGTGTTDRMEGVKGSRDHPIHRAASGGWSQQHHQQHVMDNWERNAGDVVRAIDRLVGETGPEVIAVAGDPAVIGMLRRDLPASWRDRVVEMAGGPGADGGGDHLAAEVSRLVASAAATDTVNVLRELHDHLGREDRAVQGRAGTFAALRQSRVAMLLVHDDPDDEQRASFGEQPGLVALSAADLDGVGGGPVADGRLVDVAIMAALQTGAGVRLVPAGNGPAEGMGALLRWDG